MERRRSSDFWERVWNVWRQETPPLPSKRNSRMASITQGDQPSQLAARTFSIRGVRRAKRASLSKVT
jgi:hypothetical protein